MLFRINFWGANSKKGEPPWAFTVRNLFLLFRELEAGQKAELPYNLVVIDTLKSVMSLGKVDYSISAMDTAMMKKARLTTKSAAADIWTNAIV